MTDLLDLAWTDPQQAIQTATRLLRSGEVPAAGRAHALRAIGLAKRTLGDAPGSVASLENALDAANDAGAAQLIGEVELTLAASVAFAGDLERAFQLLDTAERRLDELGRAHVAVQRAGLTARSGDFAGCLPIYAAAEPVLEAHGDARWLALLGDNRGLVYTYMGRYDAAQQDLERSRDLYERLGRSSASAEMTHNLGFLAMRRGDIPAALAAFDEAEERFRSLDIPLSELLLDRAEALLMVGLAGEARDLAALSSDSLGRAGLDIEQAEALIVHARAALAADDFAASVSSSEAAAEVMAAQGRPGWVLRARYFGAAAAVASGAAMKRTELAELASDLEVTGQIFAAFHVRLLAGRAALEAGELEVAERELAAAGEVPAAAPVDLRIQAWLARALLRRSRGALGPAAAAALAGVRLLESYRATLGATESRVNVTRHASDLFALGLELALASGRPSKVLAWSDRARSGALRLVRPTPPGDDELAGALAELRAAQGEAREAELEGEFSVEMWREQVQLERRVRRLALRQEGRAAEAQDLPQLRQLQEQLGDRTMVVFTAVGNEMVGLRLRERSIRMYRLGPVGDIERHAARARRAHRSGALPMPDEMAERTRQSLDAASGALDALLFAPLRLGEEDLVIVPPAALHSVPWPALPSLDGRTLVIAPSAYAWHRAATASLRPSLPPLLVAGPGLEHAKDEVSEVASLYQSPRVLTGGEASVAAVLKALGNAGIAHFACHANFRSDNAMFSSLVLADGDLTVYDIERAARVPEVVVLSACDSGLSEAAAGEELMGLSVALLGMGTRSLIAATSPVPDAAPTRQLMVGLHENLRAGSAPAVAMARARSGLATATRVAEVTRDAFSCLGA